MSSAACAQGLTTLGFTGHSYTQRDREYCMSPSRTAQYKATIAKLKTEYKGKVDILCGIEWDPLSEDKRTGYDYWIGSAHHLYGKNTGKYYELDFRPQDLHACIYDDFAGDPLAAVEANFAEVEKVAAMGPDILAHIDLIKKLNAAGEFFDEESPRYKAAALKALNAAKEHGCLLEVNTGSVYRGYRKDFYPSAWMLEEWNKMGGKVIITSDSHDINILTYGFDEAAAAIRGVLAQKEERNMIFAAAPSQNEMLAALAAQPGIEWNRVNAFHMDEYIGLAPDAPQGFANFLRAAIFTKVPFRSVNCLDGTAASRDPAAECARYSQLLRRFPVDITCMGIGENGHIAFNDPPVADFDDPALVKPVALDEICRNQQVHDGCFATLDDVPTHALTLTVPALMHAAQVFCVAPAATKARAVRDTLLGDIRTACPASILRRHPAATL